MKQQIMQLVIEPDSKHQTIVYANSYRSIPSHFSFNHDEDLLSLGFELDKHYTGYYIIPKNFEIHKSKMCFLQKGRATDSHKPIQTNEWYTYHVYDNRSSVDSLHLRSNLYNSHYCWWTPNLDHVLYVQRKLIESAMHILEQGINELSFTQQGYEQLYEG